MTPTTTQPLQLTYGQIYSDAIPEKIREAQKCVDVVQIVQEAESKTGKGLKTQSRVRNVGFYFRNI